MDRGTLDDYYALLGVPRAATETEVRRAYRALALRHHPDVAGAASTAVFQRIAIAYGVLTNPERRAAYDARLGAGPAPASSGRPPAPAGQERRGRGSPGQIEDPLARVSGRLDDLVARQLARRTADGAIELSLTAAEAEGGGTIALETAVRVPCPTCGGLAERGSVWCARCGYAGTVVDELTVCVPVPAFVPDGMLFSVAVDRHGLVPPIRVRVRVARSG